MNSELATASRTGAANSIMAGQARAAANEPPFSTDAYLAMDLLRLTTAGSVDDGKSTLIGRLLLDCKAIFDDQLEAVERASRQRGDPYVDLALLDRRAARRAGAGHHHRRGLPLFRHAQTQIHHRRHARATSSTPATW